MSLDVQDPPDTVGGTAPMIRSNAGVRRLLIAILVIAALAAAGTAGYLWREHSSAPPSATSVDAGFARDMSTHHQQAITMAGFVRDTTTDKAVKLLAYDIETQQYFQLGEMQGWLDSWGLTRNGAYTQMSWMGTEQMAMGPDDLMPGMATAAQLTKLESLTGPALDVFFLQLMIHHHQGGLPMEQYAAAHAQSGYVRTLAQKMVTAQSGEIIQMEQMLRARGGSPLPAPS